MVCGCSHLCSRMCTGDSLTKSGGSLGAEEYDRLLVAIRGRLIAEVRIAEIGRAKTHPHHT